MRGPRKTSSIEYGLIAALISISVIGLLTAFGGDLHTIVEWLKNL